MPVRRLPTGAHSASPRAAPSLVRALRAARVPSVDSVDDPVLLDWHHRFYATCTRVDGADRRHPHADTIGGVVA